MMPIGIWIICITALAMLCFIASRAKGNLIYRRKPAPFSKEIAEQLRKERVLYDFKQLAQKLEVENKANAIVTEFKARIAHD